MVISDHTFIQEPSSIEPSIRPFIDATQLDYLDYYDEENHSSYDSSHRPEQLEFSEFDLHTQGFICRTCGVKLYSGGLNFEGFFFCSSKCMSENDIVFRKPYLCKILPREVRVRA